MKDKTTPLTTLQLQSSPYQITASNQSVAKCITTAIENPLTFILCNSSDGSSNNWIYGAVPQSAAWKASNKLWGSDFNNTATSQAYDVKFIGKTIYDPCPHGWCAPPHDTWTNFVLFSSGYNVDGRYPSVGGVYQNTYAKDYFNTVAEDKYVYSSNMTEAPIFGHRFYINGSSGTTAFYPVSGYRDNLTGVIFYIAKAYLGWSSTSYLPNSVRSIYFGSGVYWVYAEGNHGRSVGMSVRCVKEASVR
ncbi:MAG: fibrobacter succinogenes major paralogous domain-containing protein [Bacteroides sp.]|nr:fibrobacter succinogenes major paralogous domain-containing protein [Bacteroides sp.]